MKRGKRPQFYVPNTDFWRWKLLTDTFLKVTLERCRDSYDATEGALAMLDEEVISLAKTAKQWGDSPKKNLRSIIESNYKDIMTERKRILRVQERLVQEMDRVRAELKARKLNSDRRLPVTNG